MISELQLTNFKCYKKINIPLTYVNVLTGLNGMGKSSLVQPLLLLRQTYLINKNISYLDLCGQYINLGYSKDILNAYAEQDYIEISYKSGEEKYTYKYDCSEDTTELPLCNNTDKILLSDDIFRKRFTYLSALRIPPAPSYKLTDNRHLDIGDFDSNGEFSLQYLLQNGNRYNVEEKMLSGNNVDSSLAAQVRMWMDKISPGVSPIIRAEKIRQISELSYEFREERNKSNSYRSMNVGFGITYVLPVIIALLSLKKGDMLVLENPEAHIHPAGQKALGELISRAGSCGSQIFVETHSDHVINGLRLAVKNNIIFKENINLNFFKKEKDENGQYINKIVHPKIKSDGRLDSWPKGFFDEWDNALSELL